MSNGGLLARPQQDAIRYAVVWRGGDGLVARGSLVLEGGELVLRGSDAGGSGSVERERVPLERVEAVRIGRADDERVRGERSVVLELRDGTSIAIAPLGSAGAVFELADLVAELSTAPPSPPAVAVVLPLRRGKAELAQELVSGGPPFDLEEAQLDRHQVFVTPREVVFLFEGASARETLERLVRDPLVLREAVRWRECLAGPPRVAVEAYAWGRDGT